MLDFANVEKLAEFVEDMRYNGVFPTDAVVFDADALDLDSEAGVTHGNSYILKRDGERPEHQRLVIVTTSKEARAV